MIFGQPSHPFRHHLRVAKLTEATEKRLAQFLHLLPFRIRIDGEKTIRHRSAPANGHPEVVHRIGSEVLAGLVALFQYAVRPMGEAGLLLVCGWMWQHQSRARDLVIPRFCSERGTRFWEILV